MIPALLSFCNDIDFASWDTYQEVHNILNNEFGISAVDSFWLFDPAGSDMGLFKRSLKEKGPFHDELLADIQAGRLSILHGGGNFSLTHSDQRPTRELIEEALDYLSTNAQVPFIWTNHGDRGDVTNLGGAHPVYQHGDDPGHSAYILDLLLQYGIRYFWLDHHSSNAFVFSPASTGKQPLVIEEKTRMGLKIKCFRRYRGNLKKAPTAHSLHEQLTDDNIEALVSSQGVSVIYQHWCCHRNLDGTGYTATSPVFPESGLNQLRKLSNFVQQGKIRVLPLGELLNLCQL